MEGLIEMEKLNRMKLEHILIEEGTAYERIPYANVGFAEVESSRVRFIGDVDFPAHEGTIFIEEEDGDIRYAKLLATEDGAVLYDGLISLEDDWIDKESVCSYADIEIRDGKVMCDKFEYANALVSYYSYLEFSGSKTFIADISDFIGIMEQNFYGYKITIKYEE